MADKSKLPALQSNRLSSLDAYRGFTMLAMISGGLGMKHLLGDPTWGGLADQMRHRDWEGCTFWDLIQPSFMFIVGLAMPFAFALREQRGESYRRQLWHAFRRSLGLIAVGVFLDWYHGRPPYEIRFIRVLQQIAIGYFLAFLVLHRGWRVQAIFAIALLTIHTLCFQLYGHYHDGDPWKKGANVGWWIDLHLGLGVNKSGYVTFNAISATATILFGVLAGELLRADLDNRRKLLILIAAGGAGLLIGWGLTPVVPMVKKIWTASLTFYAAGWTFLMLAGFYGVIEMLRFRRWAFPFMVVGFNSIAAYVLAQTMKEPIKRALRPFAYQAQKLAGVASPRKLDDYPIVTSVLIVLAIWSICYWMYRRRIFLKV